MPSTGYGRQPARRRGPRRRTAHTGRRRAAEFPEDSRGRRGWNEILSSASVILAGVIVVVGFGFVASRVINGDGDGDNPLPDPPPTAALGGAAEPSGSPAPIPIGSPSVSASLSPSPSATTSKTKESTKPTTKPPFQGSITITTSTVPSTVNLSAEGTIDWVHWGLEGTFSLERDKDGGFAILEGTPSAPRNRHALSPQFFTWTGGDPVDHSDGTTTGIRTCGAGNGFTISAPASTSTRVLRLYVGVTNSKGQLRASLSAGSATTSRSIEQADATFRTAVFTITYRAPASSRINLDWNTTQDLGGDCGGVALQAAILR